MGAVGVLCIARGAHAEKSESAPAPTERVTQYGEGASLGLLTTHTKGNDAHPGATGSGLSLRLASGLYVGNAFSFGVTGGFETGLGYQSLDGQYAGHLWFLLRLEGGLAARADLE